MPAAGAEAQASASSTGGAAAVHLAIGGMTCKHCVARIKSVLEQVEGVESAEVVLEPGSATVVGTASAAALIEAVEDTGKSASLHGTIATSSVTSREAGRRSRPHPPPPEPPLRWPPELSELVTVPEVAACLSEIGLTCLDECAFLE